MKIQKLVYSSTHEILINSIKLFKEKPILGIEQIIAKENVKK